MSVVTGLVGSMRVYQWTKNLVLFAGPVVTLTILDPEFAIPAILGFFTFSIATSGVYLLNDVLDVERDRLHPVKRVRPIASGRVPVPVALQHCGRAERTGFALLQQLRRHGHRDRRGLLAADAADADRHREARDPVLGEATLGEALPKALRLGHRADHARPAECAARQQRRSDRQVLVVAVGHHEGEGAGRHVGDFLGGLG